VAAERRGATSRPFEPESRKLLDNASEGNYYECKPYLSGMAFYIHKKSVYASIENNV
jgi:hypothetical protein